MRSNERKTYQNLALTVACRSTMRHKIGCILVDPRHSEHTCTFNRWLGDPEGLGWSLHAEVWGVLRAEEYGMRPTIAFVARHNGRLAKPCPKCMETLEDIGVREVWFTDGGKWNMWEIR